MISLAAGAGGLALLELEAASVGPFLLSRPFVVGPLVGWVLGDVISGALLGAIFEALTLQELPLGGCLYFSAPVAAGAAAWIAAGRSGLPIEAAFLLGLGAGWAHARLELATRRVHCGCVRRVEEELAAGARPRLGAEIAGALALQASATLVLLAALFAAAAPLSRAWPALPDFMRAGARAAFLTAPWLGAESLASALWSRA